MASTAEDRMQAITATLCASGLLHPNQDPTGERPCALCWAMARLLFGDAGVGVTLGQIRKEIGVIKSQLAARR